MKEKKITVKNFNDPCATCDHAFGKHLFGGRSCADADSHCDCELFVSKTEQEKAAA